MTDTCVSCGAPVPEGRMVCPSCEAGGHGSRKEEREEQDVLK